MSLIGYGSRLENYPQRVGELVEGIRQCSGESVFRDVVVDYLSNNQGFRVVREQRTRTKLEGGGLYIVVSETKNIGARDCAPVVKIHFSTRDKGDVPYQRDEVFGLPVSI